MEEAIKSVTDYVSALIADRWAEILTLGVLFALWRWWMGYKLRDRIAALEAKQDAASANVSPTIKFSPTISPQVEVHGAEIVRPSEAGEGVIGRQTSDYVEFGTTRGPISVSLAGGSRTANDLVRWLHEKRLLAPLAFQPADATKERWLASPGAGRTAAKLIAKAPTLEEAREVWDAFYNAQRRTDTNWAYWAFISRLEEFGHGDEVYDLTFDLYGKDGNIDPTDEIEATIKKWREE